jgi:pimeloyl-ACP methyl ester carboxylesterase
MFLLLASVSAYIMAQGYDLAIIGIILFSFICYLETVTQLSFRAPKRRKPILEGIEWKSISQQTQIGMVNSYIHEATSSDVPTLVIIHGWTSASSRMVGRARQFIERGWGVVAVDLPSHGGSDSVSKWTAEQATTTVIESLNHISTSYPFLFSRGICYYGHSMGGFIGLRLSSRRNELKPMPKILGWILESPMTGYTEIFQETCNILKIPKTIQPIVLWRMMGQFNSINHERPNFSELNETDAPIWGLTQEPTLLVQAANDERLGDTHYLRLQKCHDDAGTKGLLTSRIMESLRHSGCAVHADRDVVVNQWLDDCGFQSSSD